jgi:hypothetical protein
MPVSRDTIVRAYTLARNILRVGQPIPLSADEARLLAAVVVACAESSGIVEVPAVDQHHQIIPKEATCAYCSHTASMHCGEKGRCLDTIFEVESHSPACGCKGFVPRIGNDDPHDAVEGDALVGAVLDSEGDALPYLKRVLPLAESDAAHILETDPIYGGSWQKRGGVGAMMMLARKWDRLEERVRKMGWDIFRAIQLDTRREGAIDDVRDLRRYLLLVEAKAVEDGIVKMQTSSKDSTRTTP